MPALLPTLYKAKIIWLGRVPIEGTDLPSRSVDTISLGFEGVAGERHSGLTRPSCSRVLKQYPRGTEIRNTRQLSIVSIEEMAIIADKIGLPELTPEWLGATIVVEGIPDFSHLPASSRLQGPDGVCLTVDMQNRPCVLPGKEIEAEHPGSGAKFKPAAQGLRGVTAWVERPGQLSVGDNLRLHVPDQRKWAHEDEARQGSAA